MKKRFMKVLSFVLVFSLMLGNVAFATSGDVDPAIIAETKETAVQIESEGIVLLKNENNFLPLNNKKVNIFGAGSVCPFFGAGGDEYRILRIRLHRLSSGDVERGKTHVGKSVGRRERNIRDAWRNFRFSQSSHYMAMGALRRSAHR